MVRNGQTEGSYFELIASKGRPARQWSSLLLLVAVYVRQHRRVVALLVTSLVMLTFVLQYQVSALDRLTSASRKAAVDVLNKLTAQGFPAGVGHRDSGEDQKSSQETEDLAQVFEDRRKVYQSVCEAWEKETGSPVIGEIRDSYMYPPANFSLCGVPKVGVTFWKRVFFFLFNRTAKKGGVTSPMDVDRSYVHSHGAGSGSRLNVRENWSTLSTASRAMFSRDPWSRLWSAYIDKFILPDSWMDHGIKIVHMRDSLPDEEARSLRNQSELERRLAQSEKSPLAFHTASKTKCSDDITFAEFLRYGVENNNAHWRPVHKVCNPCVYQPQYLGKMETFGRDAAYILKTTGLSDNLKLQMSHSNHVLDELEQLTTYHYTHFQGLRKKFVSCLDNLGVARRLWRAFQLNGYISADDDFPYSELNRQFVNLEGKDLAYHVVKVVQNAHSARSLSPHEWSAFKRRAMVAAYRSVPKELLYQTQKKFQLDFELFQYDRQPSDIFGEL